MIQKSIPDVESGYDAIADEYARIMNAKVVTARQLPKSNGLLYSVRPRIRLPGAEQQKWS